MTSSSRTPQSDTFRPLRGAKILAFGYLAFAFLLLISLVLLFPAFLSFSGISGLIGWGVPRAIISGACLWISQGLWAQERRAWWGAQALQCLSIVAIGSGFIPGDMLGRLVTALIPAGASLYLWLVRTSFRSPPARPQVLKNSKP
jgi:hypothetical protein